MEFVEKVIAKERPDAVLPTMGGQTALNVALALSDSGVLAKYGVELIGANARAIRVAEDRKLFAEAMSKIGCAVRKGERPARSMKRLRSSRNGISVDHSSVVHVGRYGWRHRV